MEMSEILENAIIEEREVINRDGSAGDRDRGVSSGAIVVNDNSID